MPSWYGFLKQRFTKAYLLSQTKESAFEDLNKVKRHATNKKKPSKAKKTMSVAAVVEEQQHSSAHIPNRFLNLKMPDAISEMQYDPSRHAPPAWASAGPSSPSSYSASSPYSPVSSDSSLYNVPTLVHGSDMDECKPSLADVCLSPAYHHQDIHLPAMASFDRSADRTMLPRFSSLHYPVPVLHDYSFSRSAPTDPAAWPSMTLPSVSSSC
jgi:hypothetical protein